MKNIKALLPLLAIGMMAVLSCHTDPWVPPDNGGGDGKDDKQETEETILSPSDVPNYEKIYMCSEFYKKERGWDVTDTFYDPLKSSSLYYFGRSKQSEHFIIFWDKDYGTTTPDAAAAPYHLDTDSFLAWCEEIYKYYVETLKFAHFSPGDKSYLDSYKFQIYLWH